MRRLFLIKKGDLHFKRLLTFSMSIFMDVLTLQIREFNFTE